MVWLAALLALCIVRLWLMPLPSSFWVDEMGTRFVVAFGGDHPSFAAAPQVPASIYYALPRAIEQWFGFSEAAYRLPGVIAAGAALWLLARLARELIHPSAGWFVAFAALSLRQLNYAAGDARPYALGLCVSCLAVWLLKRWLDRERLSDAALFIAVSALLWRVHLVYWPFYLLLALYAAVRIGRRETRIQWPAAVAAFGAIGVLLIPVLHDALPLLRDAQAHVVAEKPALGDLTKALQLTLVTSCCAAAALLGRWWKGEPQALGASALTLILGWWLIHPLSLFAFSWISGSSVFVPRYLSLALPGAALTMAAAITPFVAETRWKPLAAATGAAVLLFLGRWHEPWPRHHGSDWRAAIAAVNRVAQSADTPVICPSPFIEAKPPVWSPRYPLPGFLYSHLTVYPLKATPLPFPFEPSDEAEHHAAALTRSTLRPSGRFIILGGDRNVRFWTEWFEARPELAGWSARRAGSFGDVEVTVFEAALVNWPHSCERSPSC